MLIAALVSLAGLHQATATAPPPIVDAKNYVSSAKNLKFTENLGQWNAKAKFVARTAAVDVWLTTTGVTYDWHEQTRDQNNKPVTMNHAVGVEFVGATGKGKAEGMHQVPGLSNYYLGKRAHPGVRSFSAATIKDLYPGIDLISYFDKDEQKPRYDLVVHPGANPDQIRMRYQGAKDLKVNAQGEVQYSVAQSKGSDQQVGESRQMAYQAGDKGVPYRFMPTQVLGKDGTVGFNVAGYRKDRTLVIDPLIWATFIGGDGADNVNAVKVDGFGNAYVCGNTTSSDLPSSPGVTNSGAPGIAEDAFAAKFDNQGNCIFATFYGGAMAVTEGRAVGFDSTGNLLFCGDSSERGLFVTTGPASDPGAFPSYIVSLNPAGAINYAENIVGAEFSNTGINVEAFAMVVSTAGIATVALQCGTAFAIQFDPSGTVIGSPAQAFTGSVSNVSGVAVDSAGNIFVCGGTQDAALSMAGGYLTTNPNSPYVAPYPTGFVSKIPAGGTTPSNETLIGGIGDQFVTAIRIDASDNPYVLGTILGGNLQTDSGVSFVADTFPTTPGAYSSGPILDTNYAFLSKFSNDLTTLSASTVLKTLATDDSESLAAFGFALDSTGQPLVGVIQLGGIPLTWDYFSGHAVQKALLKLSADLTTVTYGTYFTADNGSEPDALDFGPTGLIYVGGLTGSTDFPASIGGYQPVFGGGGQDGFLLALDPTVTQGIFSLVSDRGATPAIAGGVGKTLNLTANLVLPLGATVTFDSNNHGLLALNGGASYSTTVTDSSHVLSIPVTAVTDVTTDTPVVVTVSSGGFSKQITVTVKPFLKMLVLRPAAVAPGGNLTVYVYPYEVPKTNQIVNLTSDVTDFLPSGSTVFIQGTDFGGTSGPTSITLTTGNVGAGTTANVTATATTTNPSSAKAAVSILAPKVTSITFFSPTVDSGADCTATVTLAAALSQDLTVTLTSGNPTVSPNVDVTIPAGNTSGTSSLTTDEVVGKSNITVKYTNTVTPSQAGFLVVVPITSQVFMVANPVIEGDAAPLDLFLHHASAVNQPIVVTSSDTGSVPNASVTIPAGQAFFQIRMPTNFEALANPKTIKLTVTSNGNLVGTTSFTLRSIVTSENVVGPVQGGQDASGSVGFFETYNGTGTVTVTSNNPAAFFGTPGTQSITLPAHGLSSVPFTINSKTVTKTTNVTITVSALGYPAQRFPLVVNP